MFIVCRLREIKVTPLPKISLLPLTFFRNPAWLPVVVFFVAGETGIVGSASILRENRAGEGLNSRETTARRIPEETVRNESGSGQTYSIANTTAAATDARETKATEGWKAGC